MTVLIPKSCIFHSNFSLSHNFHQSKSNMIAVIWFFSMIPTKDDSLITGTTEKATNLEIIFLWSRKTSATNKDRNTLDQNERESNSIFFYFTIFSFTIFIQNKNKCFSFKIVGQQFGWFPGRCRTIRFYFARWYLILFENIVFVKGAVRFVVIGKGAILETLGNLTVINMYIRVRCTPHQ